MLGNILKKFQFKRIVQELKEHPKSHLTSFLILHEVTAIVPIPIVYQLLQRYPIDYPVDEDILTSAKKRMNRMVEILGITVEPVQLLDLVTSYLVVKALMPVRIAMSLSLTPMGARIIQKITKSL